MADLKVAVLGGEKSSSVKLPEHVFGCEVNVPLIHQVVVAQQAAARQGTHATKTRGMVSGGGAKPWRQKGTGRARHGSRRSPQWTGGGVVHGPQPRSYAQRTPKKMIAAALNSALSERVADEKLFIVDSLVEGDTPSTRGALEALSVVGDYKSALVVLHRDEDVAWLSLRNVPTVHALAVDQINTYDIVSNQVVVFTSAAMEEFIATHEDQAPAESQVVVVPGVKQKLSKIKKAEKAARLAQIAEAGPSVKTDESTKSKKADKPVDDVVVEAPVVETPVAQEKVAETPVVEAPAETAVVEVPVETPVIEEPVVEVPVAETKVEEPVVEVAVEEPVVEVAVEEPVAEVVIPEIDEATQEQITEAVAEAAQIPEVPPVKVETPSPEVKVAEAVAEVKPVEKPVAKTVTAKSSAKETETKETPAKTTKAPAAKTTTPKATPAKTTAAKTTTAKAAPKSDEPKPEYEGGYRGDNPPAGYDIKGNEDSMKYHTTESRWYKITVAEVWFNSEEAAKKAGFINVMEGKK